MLAPYCMPEVGLFPPGPLRYGWIDAGGWYVREVFIKWCWRGVCHAVVFGHVRHNWMVYIRKVKYDEQAVQRKLEEEN